MELVVGLAKELLQSAAETAVSYRPGQALLRYADRALWVVEKSARWAVPPPLEHEDSSGATPELIRPLNWVFFLGLLVALRVTREGVSLLNLLLGKPPVRPADVVMYIQSKRRYLRALKYQGNRNMRARANRAGVGPEGQWLSGVYALLEQAMCFRRPMLHAGNNNTDLSSNNDEQMLVVRKKKRGDKKKGAAGGAAAASDENSMERLIEKMVDLRGESSDDSEYTLTNAMSIKSDTSLTSSSSSEDEEEGADTAHDVTLTAPLAPDAELTSSTPKKHHTPPALPDECSRIQEEALLNASLEETESPKTATTHFISSESNIESELSVDNTPKKAAKLANGQTRKTTPNTKKDSPKRRDSEVPVVKITPADDLNNTNGSTEGSYSQPNQGPNRARDNKSEGTSKVIVLNQLNTGKSPKPNKAKESKIKPPFWKKSKK